MTPLKVLIVDDEAPARAKLRRLLLAHAPGVQVVGEAGDALEALRLAEALQPDLALLDIQMPGMSGLELALALPPATHCAFCTAFEQHALRAFELNAVDYLLKPFSAERLDQTLARLRQRISASINSSDRSDKERPRAALLSALQQLQPVSGHWLVPQRGGGLMKLALAQVEWVAAADNYIALHAPPAQHLDRHTLADFLAHAAVQQAGFVRVHRSHAVNPAHIQGIASLARGEAELTLSSGAKLRVSRGYREQLI
nr:response regulator [uncultured Roseateles sp.]